MKECFKWILHPPPVPKLLFMSLKMIPKYLFVISDGRKWYVSAGCSSDPSIN
jgi:hypothetical protein